MTRCEIAGSDCASVSSRFHRYNIAQNMLLVKRFFMFLNYVRDLLTLLVVG